MSATNEVGPGPFSDAMPLRGGVASPGKPGTPVKKSTDKTSITIKWSAPTDNGGADVTNYEVLMDDGKGGKFTSIGLTGNQLEYAVSGLSTGLAYRF